MALGKLRPAIDAVSFSVQVHELPFRRYTVAIEQEQQIVAARRHGVRRTAVGCVDGKLIRAARIKRHMDDPLFAIGLVCHGHWTD